MQHKSKTQRTLSKLQVSLFLDYELTTFALTFFLKNSCLNLWDLFRNLSALVIFHDPQEMRYCKLYFSVYFWAKQWRQKKQISLLFYLFSKCCLSDCALHKYPCHEEQRKWMKANLTSPFQDAAFIQLDDLSLNAFFLESFLCISIV